MCNERPTVKSRDATRSPPDRRDFRVADTFYLRFGHFLSTREEVLTG